jgi:type II secretory pathway pseudopilin PulG
MLKQRHTQTGFTWISLLAILVILGSLLVAGASNWRHACVLQAKRVLFNDIARALAFSRTEAFLSGNNLVLQPLDKQSNNWALGIHLQTEKEPLCEIHRWPWEVSRQIKLTWHGFLGQNKLVVSAKPESLAMNGYFLLEPIDGQAFSSEKWVVNRFGRMRVLRKHVA